jgi:hypothetical protein
MAYNSVCEMAAPARAPEVPAAIAALHDSLGYLATAVVELEGRTASVCRPPSDDKAGGCGIVAGCEVAMQVLSAAANMDALTARLRDLLDRLEI